MSNKRKKNRKLARKIDAGVYRARVIRARERKTHLALTFKLEDEANQEFTTRIEKPEK